MFKNFNPYKAVTAIDSERRKAIRIFYLNMGKDEERKHKSVLVREAIKHLIRGKVSPFVWSNLRKKANVPLREQELTEKETIDLLAMGLLFYYYPREYHKLTSDSIFFERAFLQDNAIDPLLDLCNGEVGDLLIPPGKKSKEKRQGSPLGRYLPNILREEHLVIVSYKTLDRWSKIPENNLPRFSKRKVYTEEEINRYVEFFRQKRN
jgi:hypothetical protein